MPKTTREYRNRYPVIASRRDVPLTSETQLVTDRKKINAANKQRAANMERRVAKYLKGRRTPMSGGMAQYKGDVEIPFVNNAGGYLIECKLSAQAPGDLPQIRLIYKWFPKIHLEARNMPGMKFGVLILHYHKTADDYVFVRRDIVDKLITKYESTFSQELSLLLSQTNILDLVIDRPNKIVSSYLLRKHHIDRAMISINGIYGARVLLPDSEYLVMKLESFRTVIDTI